MSADTAVAALLKAAVANLCFFFAVLGLLELGARFFFALVENNKPEIHRFTYVGVLHEHAGSRQFYEKRPQLNDACPARRTKSAIASLG
jgi:hypothetical protein